VTRRHTLHGGGPFPRDRPVLLHCSLSKKIRSRPRNKASARASPFATLSRRRMEPEATFRQFVSRATRPGSRVAFWLSVTRRIGTPPGGLLSLRLYGARLRGGVPFISFLQSPVRQGGGFFMDSHCEPQLDVAALPRNIFEIFFALDETIFTTTCAVQLNSPRRNKRLMGAGDHSSERAHQQEEDSHEQRGG
jgi:hypothetical protein